jgi:hypothetical protein
MHCKGNKICRFCVRSGRAENVVIQIPAHGIFAASSFLGQVATADNSVHVSMYIVQCAFLHVYYVYCSTYACCSFVAHN